MNYYVINVRTGSEKKYVASTRRVLPQTEGRLIWPRRCLSIRKAGKTNERISSLYPGYLFWETEILTDVSRTALIKTPGFIKFLKSGNKIVPLVHREKEIFLELISYGEIIQKSRVVFDENNRIRVIDGPLLNLEGNIVKVDRRKERAKVLLSLHGKTLMVDIGFKKIETF